MSVAIAPRWRALTLALLAVAAFRLGATAAISHPGYTDAYYYFAAAERLAAGQGLTVDLVWNFLEAPRLEPLPIPSHRFWMPLATLLQSGGIAALGDAIGAFRAAQLPMLLVALLIPAVTFVAARRVGLDAGGAALAALVAGAGGALAPAWSSLDNFAVVALLGTLLLASLDGVARGRGRDAVVAGLALGGLLLSRGDGALFAVALATVAARAPRAALLAAGVAALVALPWYARTALLGVPEGQLARAALLVAYEDFFRIAPPDPGAFLAAPERVLAARADALRVNAGLFVLLGFVLLGPLAVLHGWRERAGRGSLVPRAWLATLAVLYLVHSLGITLHSLHNAFTHSLAGLLPVGVALGVAEGERLLAVLLERWAARGKGFARQRRVWRPHARVSERSVAALALAVASLALSAFAVLGWRESFDAQLAARGAVVASGAVATPALVIDAAAWRAILDGPTLVTPADGLDAARAVARRYRARTLVLEGTHFSAYHGLYTGTETVDWLELVRAEGETRVFRVRAP